MTDHAPRPRDPGPRFNNRISPPAGSAAPDPWARFLRQGLGLGFVQAICTVIDPQADSEVLFVVCFADLAAAAVHHRGLEDALHSVEKP